MSSANESQTSLLLISVRGGINVRAHKKTSRARGPGFQRHEGAPQDRKIEPPDYMRLPGSRVGALSCLTGIAARKSMDMDRPVKIADLVSV